MRASIFQSIENLFYLKRRFYHFQLKNGIFIGEHMKNYMNLLPDLANVDEVIKNENQTLILLVLFRIKSMSPSF